MSEGTKDTASEGEGKKGAEAPQEETNKKKGACAGQAGAELHALAVNEREGGGKGLAKGSQASSYVWSLRHRRYKTNLQHSTQPTSTRQSGAWQRTRKSIPGVHWPKLEIWSKTKQNKNPTTTT